MGNYEYYASTTNAGGRVRPRNWSQRVALLASTFGSDKKLKYNQALIPTIHNDEMCLRIDKEQLCKDCPGVYRHVIGIIESLDAKKVD